MSPTSDKVICGGYLNEFSGVGRVSNHTGMGVVILSDGFPNSEVPNNHSLSQNLHQNCYSLSPKHQVLGPSTKLLVIWTFWDQEPCTPNPTTPKHQIMEQLLCDFPFLHGEGEHGCAHEECSAPSPLHLWGSVECHGGSASFLEG